MPTPVMVDHLVVASHIMGRVMADPVSEIVIQGTDEQIGDWVLPDNLDLPGVGKVLKIS